MADDKLALTQTPADLADALDMAGALANRSDGQTFGWNDNYNGVEYQSARELVEALNTQKAELEAFGRELLAALPADLPDNREDATTDEQLKLIILREQINLTFFEATRSNGSIRRSNIDTIIDPNENVADDGIEHYRGVVDEQHAAILRLYETDENQDVSNALRYLEVQRRAYNTLLDKQSQFGDIRAAFQTAGSDGRPVSKEDWARISRINMPPENISDIKQISSLNRFYATRQQQSVAVSFVEMRQKQTDLENQAQTLRSSSPDAADAALARAEALNLILDREASIMALVTASVAAGNSKQGVISSMDASEQAAAGIMLQGQQRDYAIIDHTAETLRRIYDSSQPADRNDLLRIISPTDQPETINQAQLKAEWNVLFAQDGKSRAETLFEEMRQQRQQHLDDATASEAANPQTAARSRELAQGLDTVLAKEADIMALLEQNIMTAEGKRVAIDQLTSDERHMALALSTLGDQEAAVRATDGITADLRRLIDRSSPVTREDAVHMLIGTAGLQTVAQIKTLSRWNIETAQESIAETNASYDRLEQLKTNFEEMAVRYSTPGMEDSLAQIQARIEGIQRVLDDRALTTTQIDAAVAVMEGRRDQIQNVPNDAVQFDFANRLLTLQRGQLSQIDARTATVATHVLNYEIALASGGINAAITGAPALPSAAAPAVADPNADPATGVVTRPPAAVEDDPVTTRRRPTTTGGGQTTEEQQIVELKNDANSIIRFRAAAQGGELELSNGERLKFGTNTIQEIAFNNAKTMNDMIESAEDLKDALRTQGRGEEADSIDRSLTDMRRLSQEAITIGQTLEDMNTQAKELQGEIAASGDINVITDKLRELTQIHEEMEDIAHGEFQAKVDAFSELVTRNQTLNEQLNGEMSLGGFARNHLGELGRRLVGPGDGGPSILGDLGNSLSNTFGDFGDWYGRVRDKYGNSTGFMIFETLGIGAIAAAGISLWNNTGGKLTGFQLNGIWKFLGVAAAVLFGMSQTSANATDAEVREAMQKGFSGQGNTAQSFRQMGGGSPVADLSSDQETPIRNQKTGEPEESHTIEGTGGAETRESNHDGDMQLRLSDGRTTMQGGPNSPEVLAASASVPNIDSEQALIEAAAPLVAGQTGPHLGAAGQRV